MTPSPLTREQAIINASAELFASRGFAAVGIDDIGEAVGITGPAVYRYFASKDAILEAVFALTTEAMVDNLSVFDSAEGIDPEELLRRTASIALDSRAALATTAREMHRITPELLRKLEGPLLRLEQLRGHAAESFNPKLDEAERQLRIGASAGLLNAVMTSESALPRPALDERLVRSNAAVFRAPAHTGDAPVLTRWDPPTGRRDEILRAALALIHTHGFHAVTVDEIAAEANVPTRALYRQFKNKSDILIDAFDRADCRIGAVREVALANSASAADVVVRLSHELAAAVLRDVDLALVVHRERRSAEKVMEELRFHAFTDLTSTWIAALREARPDVSATEAPLMVEMAIALIHSAAETTPDHRELADAIGALAVAHFHS